MIDDYTYGSYGSIQEPELGFDVLDGKRLSPPRVLGFSKEYVCNKDCFDIYSEHQEYTHYDGQRVAW